MGRVIHHNIVCTSHFEEHILKAYKQAVKIFDPLSNLCFTQLNGYYSFFIPTDGSKEGWEESDEGDKRRQEFIDWLKKENLYVDWIEISYGEDSTPQVLNSGKYVEKDE